MKYEIDHNILESLLALHQSLKHDVYTGGHTWRVPGGTFTTISMLNSCPFLGGEWTSKSRDN